MKKNNPYITGDEINLGDLVRTLWREKILILSISIICGLFGCLYGFFIATKEFKTEVTLRDPPVYLFQAYEILLDKNALTQMFISNFKSNFFSLDNLESFVEESREIDNFKRHLKLKNTTVKKYFFNKLGEDKKVSIISLSKYFLLFPKELEGDIFLNDYVEFINKKNKSNFKNNLKIELEYKINLNQQALNDAKLLLNSKNPTLRLPDNLKDKTVDLENFLYKSDLLLIRDINTFSLNAVKLNKLLEHLENNQFNYNIILDKASPPVLIKDNVSFFLISGLIMGLILSLVILFFKSICKTKVKI